VAAAVVVVFCVVGSCSPSNSGGRSKSTAVGCGTTGTVGFGMRRGLLPREGKSNSICTVGFGIGCGLLSRKGKSNISSSYCCWCGTAIRRSTIIRR